MNKCNISSKPTYTIYMYHNNPNQSWCSLPPLPASSQDNINNIFSKTRRDYALQSKYSVMLFWEPSLSHSFHMLLFTMPHPLIPMPTPQGKPTESNQNNTLLSLLRRKNLCPHLTLILKCCTGTFTSVLKKCGTSFVWEISRSIVQTRPCTFLRGSGVLSALLTFVRETSKYVLSQPLRTEHQLETELQPLVWLEPICIFLI